MIHSNRVTGHKMAQIRSNSTRFTAGRSFAIQKLLFIRIAENIIVSFAISIKCREPVASSK